MEKGEDRCCHHKSTLREEKEPKEKIMDDGDRPAERKETMTKVMSIEGMMCAHCTGRVQKAQYYKFS